jgi:aspartate racemase
MKKIGLIGGLTWESTAEYYRLINEMVHERLGKRHSAEMIVGSFDFDPINRMMVENNWDGVGELLFEMARNLEKAGAECLLICCNTLHRLADRLECPGGAKLIHIIDVIADEIIFRKMKKVGLMGSTYTMKEDFYRDRLAQQGIEVVIPEENDMKIIMEVIETELGVGKIKKSSRKYFVEIINNLRAKGAEGVILGCTEIPLLIRKQDTPVALFDSTWLHSAAAVNFALE